MSEKKPFGYILKSIRQAKGWSLEQLAEKTGTTKQVLSRYERGERSPKISDAKKLADALNVTLSELYGETPTLPPNLKSLSDIQPARVPLVGSVAAGEPILAEEEYDVYIDAPFKADYALRIEGESMVPTYEDGDIIYIKAQDTIDYDGQIAVILLDDSATVKHVYREKDGVLLVSDNPKYKPMRFTQNDCNSIRIFGKVCGYTRMYKG